MKFLLGSNLKAQLGETEVTREADVSGEKCGVTADPPSLPGSCAGVAGKDSGGGAVGGDSGRDAGTPRPVSSGPCTAGAVWSREEGLK